VEGI
jgi:hypothetical protein